jgi:glucose 1-dehydrogenase
VRAVVIDYNERRLRMGEIAEPAIAAPDQVLIRIEEVGVCGTDRELANFDFGYPPEGEPMLALGHEAVGRVEAVGSAVTRVRPGDWVVPAIRRACSPACVSCARGRRDLCLTGGYRERGIFGLHGYLTELAVDREIDLLRVDPAVCGYAVLIEPMSTVEKAVESALRLHPGGPERALVQGAGPVGILAAFILQLRGLEVAVYSLEPAGHPRARVVEAAGIPYRTTLEPDMADIIIEATGSAEAPVAALAALRAQGVLMLLGASNSSRGLPFKDMIRSNQVIAGSVNASPQAFAAAAADLGSLPRAALDLMVRRHPLAEFERTILGPAPETPKLVHRVRESLN